MFRSDLVNLLPGNEDAHRLAAQTATVGELLSERADDCREPHRQVRVMVQPHCHQHAVLHYTSEQQLLEQAGVDVDVLDAGCCGLAGNFGFERGHFDVSVACAEDKLLPALRQTDPETVIIADGFSCRTQIRELMPGSVPLHTIQVLAGLQGN